MSSSFLDHWTQYMSPSWSQLPYPILFWLTGGQCCKLENPRLIYLLGKHLIRQDAEERMRAKTKLQIIIIWFILNLSLTKCKRWQYYLVYKTDVRIKEIMRSCLAQRRYLTNAYSNAFTYLINILFIVHYETFTPVNKSSFR